MPTVLITGANRGLGLEFVRQYAADGWYVIAVCRDPAKAADLKNLANADKNIRIESLDVADFSGFAGFAQKLGTIAIDVLINNAGILSGGKTNSVSADHMDNSQSFGSIDPDAWDKVLRINTLSPILLTQHLVPHLKRAEKAKAINITSKMGAINEMGSEYIAYRTSKAALNAAMRTIMHDLKADGIITANLHPGWVQTDMGGPQALITPEISITGMRKVINGLTTKDSGRFLAYDGKEIAW